MQQELEKRNRNMTPIKIRQRYACFLFVKMLNRVY